MIEYMKRKSNQFLDLSKKKTRKSKSFIILNEVNIDYDTLVKLLSEVRRKGRLY